MHEMKQKFLCLARQHVQKTYILQSRAVKPAVGPCDTPIEEKVDPASKGSVKLLFIPFSLYFKICLGVIRILLTL